MHNTRSAHPRLAARPAPRTGGSSRLWRAASALLVACFALASNAEGLKAGEVAPSLDVATISARVIAAQELEGKVVLHYFWATWCPICRADLPQLQKLYDSHRSRGFEIVAHSLDQDRAAVIDYWRDHGYTFPAAMRSHAVRAAYGPIRGTPTFFLVDRAGTVRLKRLGVLPEGQLDAQIAQLLSREGGR